MILQRQFNGSKLNSFNSRSADQILYNKFKYDLNAPEFLEINVSGAPRQNVQRRNKLDSTVSVSSQKAYAAWIPIDAMKKTDLLTMLRKRIIPKDYQYFYDNLPAMQKPVKRSALPALKKMAKKK